MYKRQSYLGHGDTGSTVEVKKLEISNRNFSAIPKTKPLEVMALVISNFVTMFLSSILLRDLAALPKEKKKKQTNKQCQCTLDHFTDSNIAT